MTLADTLTDRGCRSLHVRRLLVELIVVAIVAEVVTLVSAILSNSKSQAVMAVKLDASTAKVEKHNRVLERTYALEQDMALVKNDIESIKGKVG